MRMHPPGSDDPYEGGDGMKKFMDVDMEHVKVEINNIKSKKQRDGLNSNHLDSN